MFIIGIFIGGAFACAFALFAVAAVKLYRFMNSGDW